MTTLGGALMPHIIVEGLSFDTLAPSALVGIGVLLILTGRLIPRSTLEAERKAYEKRIEDIDHDRNEWRAAHRISEQARLEEREHNTALINDIAGPVKGFLEGVRKVTRVEVDES